MKKFTLFVTLVFAFSTLMAVSCKNMTRQADKIAGEIENAAQNATQGASDLLSGKIDGKAVKTDKYEGTVPAASNPGITYNLTLIGYEGTDNGIYHLKRTYIEGTPEGNYVDDEYGRFTVSGTDGARVMKLTSFDGKNTEGFSIDGADAITMLDEDMKRIESEFNYTLRRVM